MQIKLKAFSKRAKDRINQHGEIFRLIQKNKFNDFILVESLNNTFNKNTEKWLGWFEVDKDVEIIN